MEEQSQKSEKDPRDLKSSLRFSSDKPRIFYEPSKKSRSAFGLGSIPELIDPYSKYPSFTLAVHRPYEIPIKRLLNHMDRCIRENKLDDFVLLFRQFPYYHFEYLISEAAMSNSPEILNYLLEKLQKLKIAKSDPGRFKIMFNVINQKLIMNCENCFAHVTKFSLSPHLRTFVYQHFRIADWSSLYLEDSRLLYILRISMETPGPLVIHGISIKEKIFSMIFHPETYIPKDFRDLLGEIPPEPPELRAHLETAIEAINNPERRNEIIEILNEYKLCITCLFKTLQAYDRRTEASTDTGKRPIYFLNLFKTKLLEMFPEDGVPTKFEKYYNNIRIFIERETTHADRSISILRYDRGIIGMIDQLSVSDVIKLTDTLSNDILDSWDSSGSCLIDLFSVCKKPIKILIHFRERGIDISKIQSLEKVFSDQDIEYDDFKILLKELTSGEAKGPDSITKWCASIHDSFDPNPEVLNYLITNGNCSIKQFVQSPHESTWYVLVKGQNYIPTINELKLCIRLNFISVLYLVYRKLKKDPRFKEYQLLLREYGINPEAFEDIVEPPFVGGEK